MELSIDHRQQGLPRRPGARRCVVPPQGRRDPRADGRERRRQVDADQDHHRRLPARFGASLLDGQPVEFASPRDALAAGIGAVHQERNLIPRFSVGENILLERLPTGNGLVDYAEVHREARAYLDLLDRGIDTRAEVRRSRSRRCRSSRSPRRCRSKAKLLLLDEPTASITEHEAAALFDVLRRLRARASPSSSSATSSRRCSRSPTA